MLHRAYTQSIIN